MGILSRFADIMASNINALLDKAEDPEKMIDQCLRKALDQLAKVKEETAGVMAEEQRCQRLLQDAQDDVNKYDDLARKALAAGNEDDARVFLGRKQQCSTALDKAQSNYAVAAENAEKMRQMHDKLAADIQALKARRDNVKATMAVARTQERVNDAQAAFDGASGAIAGFTRMEEKAQRMLDSSTAKAKLSAAPKDPAEDLAAKYAGGGPAAVDDELAKMKAEMGLS